VTTLYLSGASAVSLEAIRTWDWEKRPLAVLVSFVYLKNWEQIAPYYRAPSALMLDSGAFTAHTSGTAIDHDALIAEAKNPRWTEAIGLDVIGDWKASKANAEREAALGASKMIPTFHLGDPWELLAFYKARFPKIGIGGMVGAPKPLIMKFLDQVFARAWPHRLHSFGRAEDDILMRFPFESADSATWLMAPRAFRNWMVKRRGKEVQQHLSVEGSKMLAYGVTNHMESNWRRQQLLMARWRSTLAPLRGEGKASA
jgi:hypothetical protein